MKRIAIFLDGTWEIVDNNTNVWRLKSLCLPKDPLGIEQVTYYDAGLGTKPNTRYKGGMLGYGIDQAVSDAYEWLMEKYEDEDEVFIFGFSRGAFTARSLSGLISHCGLVSLGAPLSVGQLYRRYQRGNPQTGEEPRTLVELAEARDKGRDDFSPEERWMLSFCRSILVKFTGVWETVGALAKFPRPLWWLSGGRHDFLDVNLRRSQNFAFHALAVDEHTKAFAPTLFTHYVPIDPNAWRAPERPLSQVEQRWFIGSHGDVGGGHDMDFLAEFPFRWLMGKAKLSGLALREAPPVDPDANLGSIENTYNEFVGGLYRRIYRPFYRAIGMKPERRTTTVVHSINETIDKSVFDRWRRDNDYRPPNLITWASQYEVNIRELASSVRANDPKQAVPD